jgi:hypothetical protein
MKTATSQHDRFFKVSSRQREARMCARRCSVVEFFCSPFPCLCGVCVLQRLEEEKDGFSVVADYFGKGLFEPQPPEPSNSGKLPMPGL